MERSAGYVCSRSTFASRRGAGSDRHIVLKCAGPLAAERYCVPHALVTPVEVAGPDAAANADADQLGPIEGLLAGANDDTAAALVLYRNNADLPRRDSIATQPNSTTHWMLSMKPETCCEV